MIPVKNIYYMLSYAFSVLQEKGYRRLATEEFANVADLMAAILAKEISVQLKRGLLKEYLPQNEDLSCPKGKLNIAGSLKRQTFLKRKINCSFDEFSVNAILNRIIKSTVLLLLKSDISKERAKQLRKLMVFFKEISPIDLSEIDWKLHYNRNNQSYQMLISICYLVVKGLLHTQQDGSTKLIDFLDEQRMCRLYEKFILNYYAKEWQGVLKARASQISWAVDDGYNDLLPVMQSDIMLSRNGNVLIIDAKYYAHTLQDRFYRHSIHSSNIYQIFTYVKNKEQELINVPHSVSGMLLYARTDEKLQPDNEYILSGNKVSVKTLNLNTGFDAIRKYLDEIVQEHFQVSRTLME